MSSPSSIRIRIRIRAPCKRSGGISRHCPSTESCSGCPRFAESIICNCSGGGFPAFGGVLSGSKVVTTIRNPQRSITRTITICRSPRGCRGLCIKASS